MKTTKTLLLLSALLLTFSACKKKDVEAAVAAANTGGGGGTTTIHKAMMSSWAVDPNQVLAVRFDLFGNLTGATFQMVLKCADTTEVWCPNTTLTGDQDFGTFNVPSTCIDHGGQSTSFITLLQTGGAGSYTNTNGVLTLCKHNGSCFTFQ